MKRKLLKLSLCQLIIAIITFVINYFVYHFVTDEGITLVWQAEPGKPFVAMLIGVFATLFLFGSALSALAAFVIADCNDKQTLQNKQN